MSLSEWAGCVERTNPACSPDHRGLFHGGLYKECSIYRNYYDGKRCPSIICNGRERATDLIATNHSVVPIWGIYHDVRVPMAGHRPQVLVSGEHICERYRLHLGQLSFAVRCLDTRSNFVRSLAFQS